MNSSLVEQLLAAANQAIAATDESAEAQLNAIDNYSKLFATLQETELLSALSEQELQTINQRHEQVLLRAKELEAKMSDDMKDLRVRGKALLKYLDILPKRISSRRTRKG